MNFIGEIGNLTLPQIQEYLSGKRPFPGGQMALAAHMPALAAQAVRMRMKDGGEVPQIDKRMQALLAQRFSNGGGVSKYGYVIVYDVNGNEIGVRKDSDPPLPGEAGTKAAGMYRASDAAQPSMFTSPEEKAKYMEGKRKAVEAIPNMAKDALGGIMDLIGMNTKPWAPNKPDMAALNKAIDDGKIPPMPPEVRAEQEAFRKSVGIGSNVPVERTPFAFPTINDADARAAYRDIAAKNKGATPESEIEALEKRERAAGLTDRSVERLKGVESLRAGVEQDRELGKWMALAQFASGMQGKRNFAAGMAGGIERGLPAFAAAQAAYRKGLSEAEDKKLRIEDAADAILRDRITRGTSSAETKQGKYVAAVAAEYGLNKDQAEMAIKKAEFMQKERALDIEAQKASDIGAYYRSGGAKGAGAIRGPNNLTAKEAIDKVIAARKLAGGYDPLAFQKDPKHLAQLMKDAEVFYGGPLPAGGMMEGADEMPGWGQPKVTSR